MQDLLQQSIEEIHNGKRDEARNHLTALIKQNPNNEFAWGWLFNVSNTEQERIQCLEQVLRINPQNEKANQLLRKYLPKEKILPEKTDEIKNAILQSLPIEFSPEKGIKRDRKIAIWLIIIGVIGFIFFLSFGSLINDRDGLISGLGCMTSVFLLALGGVILLSLNVNPKGTLRISHGGVSIYGTREKRNDWNISWGDLGRVNCQLASKARDIIRINLILNHSRKKWMSYGSIVISSYSIGNDFYNLENIYYVICEYRKQINWENQEKEKERIKQEGLRLEQSQREKDAYLRHLTKLTELQKLNPIKFEELIGEIFSRMGYSITLTKASGDQGVDLFIRKNGQLGIIQCKRYRGDVGQPVVRDFFGTMIHNQAK
jgi:tetratricopeptide (TPR) repeat protein